MHGGLVLRSVIFLPKTQNITQFQPQELFSIQYNSKINSYNKVSLKFLVMIIEQRSRPAANAQFVPSLWQKSYKVLTSDGY
jgi:hypothetical protein